MARTRTLLVLFGSLLIAVGAMAQNAAEFGHASGGAIDMITKAPRQTSGSLALSESTGLFRGRGYEATLRGELVNDRLWFFGAASLLPRARFTTDVPAFDAKATAQPLDWTNVAASMSRRPAYDGALPASFLTLRSTSILSDRMTLDLHVSTIRAR